MSNQAIELSNFNLGGISDSDDMGYANSMSELVGMDIHSQAGVVQPNFRMDKKSGSTIDEKIIKQVTCSDGNVYLFSYESGKVWKYDGTTVSLAYTTVPTDGEAKTLGACEFRGYVYWASQNWLHRIRVSGTSDWATNSEINWGRFTKDDVFLDIPAFVARLDGVDDYFQAETASELAFTDDNIFTFSAWVRLDEGAMEKRNVIWAPKKSSNDEFQIEIGRLDADTRGVIVRKTGSSNINVAVAGEVKEFRYVLYGGFESQDTSSSPVQVRSGSIKPFPEVIDRKRLRRKRDSGIHTLFDGEEWVHIAYRRNGVGSGAHSIFINGVEKDLASQSTSAFTDRATDKYIGACHDNTDFEDAYFSGGISNVIFFDTAMTDQEISDLYEHNSYDASDVLSQYIRTPEDTTPNNGAFFDYDYNWDRFHLRGNDLPTSINEEDTNKKIFYATQSPIVTVRINVANVGAGDWTVTIHDSTDSTIDSATILNGSMALGFNDFTLSSFEPEYGTEYHIHIHSSASGAALKTRTPNGVQDAQIEIYGQGSNEIHPMIEQNRVLYIGDRSLVHQVSSVGGLHALVLNALDIPQPNIITALGKYETHLVIGTKIADGIGNAKVYRWDTYSLSFNVVDEVDEPGINAFMVADNYLFVQAGNSGSLYYYNGAKLQKARKIKGVYTPATKDKIWPDASTTFGGLLHFGLSNVSGSPASQGIYSYGSINEAYPTVLNLEYPIKDGSDLTLSDIEVTSLCIYDNKLLAAWYDSQADEHGLSEVSTTERISGGYVTSRIVAADRKALKLYGRIEVCYRSLPDATNTQIKIYADSGDGNGLVELGVSHDEERRLYFSNDTIQSLSLRVKVEVINTVDQTQLPIIEKIYIRPRGAK